jgi:phosphoribosyl 1,2-cyclic phosphodiesterase
LDAILVEANHDVNMLQTGPYPYQLKQRIWSDKGHLSNETCGHLMNEIISEKLKHVILGHLSQENNYPDLAYEAVRNEINIGPTDFRASDINIKVAREGKPSAMAEF